MLGKFPCREKQGAKNLLSRSPKPTRDLRCSIAGFVFHLRYTFSNEFLAGATQVVFVGALHADAAGVADKAVIDGCVTVLAEVHRSFLPKMR
jgi:hypothetical protein